MGPVRPYFGPVRPNLVRCGHVVSVAEGWSDEMPNPMPFAPRLRCSCDRSSQGRSRRPSTTTGTEHEQRSSAGSESCRSAFVFRSATEGGVSAIGTRKDDLNPPTADAALHRTTNEESQRRSRRPTFVKSGRRPCMVAMWGRDVAGVLPQDESLGGRSMESLLASRANSTVW